VKTIRSPPTPASLQVTPRATTADSPTPKLSFAEKLQAKKQKEEATQKLFRAVMLNKVAQVKELLEKGADPNVLGKGEGFFVELFPLYVAAKGKFNEVLHLLIEHKANLDGINTYYGTALHAAINNHNQEGVEALLAAGADPNKVNGMGYSPLQNAVQNGDYGLGIVEALLMAEADVNAKNAPWNRIGSCSGDGPKTNGAYPS
jgi:ankyrin repeat protein